jgi:Tfp pilus assembly ATPase PilU
MGDIKRMILNNNLFRNLDNKDQRKLAELIYKSEMIEVFVRDKELVRINESFESIVEAVAEMLDERLEEDYPEDDSDDYREK